MIWTGEEELTQAAVDYGSDGEPSTSVEASLWNDPKIEFVEDSFEWENLAYELLSPSFGSRQSLREGFADTDPDPHFQDFLNAGYARVLVPVRPGRDVAARVLYFQATGRIWASDDPPAFDESWPDGARFNAILEDLTDETGIVDLVRDTEIAADDPDSWTTRVPTTLVKLQLGMTLPGEEG